MEVGFRDLLDALTDDGGFNYCLDLFRTAQRLGWRGGDLGNGGRASRQTVTHDTCNSNARDNRREQDETHVERVAFSVFLVLTHFPAAAESES